MIRSASITRKRMKSDMRATKWQKRVVDEIARAHRREGSEISPEGRGQHGWCRRRYYLRFSSEIDDSRDGSCKGGRERGAETGRGRDERERRIDRVASVGRSKEENRWPKERAAIYAARESKARTEATTPRRRSSVESDAFRIERGERIERASGRDETVGCESAKSSEGRQRIAESHG